MVLISDQLKSRAIKAMQKAKRHFNSVDLSAKGKAHREHRKVKRSAGEMKALLAHNAEVAKINSTPAVFTLWDRPYDEKCMAEKCKAEPGEYIFYSATGN